MKKSILMLLAAFMLLAVSSCNEDDDQGPDKKQIIIDNQWKLTSVESEKESAELETAMTLFFGFATIEYDFQNNGVYEIIFSSSLSTEDDVETGTWSISDDYKNLTIDGGVGTVEQCTETTLKLKSGPENIQIGEDISGYDTGDITLVFTAVAE
jgi:PBP1b-binding outer membrane lipoprotein LpoB